MKQLFFIFLFLVISIAENNSYAANPVPTLNPSNYNTVDAWKGDLNNLLSIQQNVIDLYKQNISNNNLKGNDAQIDANIASTADFINNFEIQQNSWFNANGNGTVTLDGYNFNLSNLPSELKAADGSPLIVIFDPAKTQAALLSANQRLDVIELFHNFSTKTLNNVNAIIATEEEGISVTQAFLFQAELLKNFIITHLTPPPVIPNPASSIGPITLLGLTQNSVLSEVGNVAGNLHLANFNNKFNIEVKTAALEFHDNEIETLRDVAETANQLKIYVEGRLRAW